LKLSSAVENIIYIVMIEYWKYRLICLILPGLTSSSNTSYVKTLAMTIVNSGAIVAVQNQRGLGGVPLKTPRTYCATNNEDVREVIAHLKKKYPGAKMVAIGTSLGGMILSRYLITCPEEAKETFAAALVISICWDPVIGNASLEKPWLNKYIINYTLTSNLQDLAKRYIYSIKKKYYSCVQCA
jgi:abhydrolase domain-containing protein 1/3